MSSSLSCHEISEVDEEFDPMAKDFHDPEFNSYKSGRGSFINPRLHTQKRWEGESENYKLHVCNIPLGINNEGFQHVFANFGKVLKMYLTTAKNEKTKWGFVEYRTLREAERAIYSVNKVAPLNMVVKFALTDEAKANRQNEFKFDTPSSAMESLSKNEMPPVNKPEDLIGRGRGLLITSLQGIKPHDMTSKYSWYTPYFLCSMEPVQSHPYGEFSLYFGDEILDIYNETLTYEKPVTKSGNKFMMYMGRGYCLKDLIDHSERYFHPEKNVFNFSNERSLSSYQSNTCFLCANEAVRICFNCNHWYCSKDCFRNDLPNHIICTSGLVVCYNVDKSKTSNVSLSRYTKSQIPEKGVFVKKLIFPPLRDDFSQTPKTADESFKQIDGKTRRDNISNRNSHLINNNFIRDVNVLINVNDGSSQSLIEENPNLVKSRTSFDGSNLILSDHLPNDCFTLVKICNIMDGFTYWVNNMEMMSDVFEVTKSLFNHCRSKKAKPLSALHPQAECAAYSQGFWYRGRIISCDNRSVKVFLIDQGREEVCLLHELKTLPMDLMAIPPLAFKIRFADGTPDKYKNLTDPDEVSVKPVSVECDTIVVHAENEIYQALNLSSSEMNNSIPADENSPIPFTSFSEVKVAHVEGRKEYWVNPLAVWNELSEMSLMLNIIGKSAKHITVPQLGETYIKNFQNFWCRAKVTCVDPLTIFYIDYGNYECMFNYNDELRQLPTMMQTHRFPPMAIKIKLAEKTSEKLISQIKLADELRVKPISMVNECYVVIVEGQDCLDSSNSSIDKLSHTLNESLIKYGVRHLLFIAKKYKKFELTVNQVMSKSRVCGYININPYYVHPTLKAIDKQIANASIYENENKVVLGEMVGCLIQDGLCARGYVTSIINNTKRVALTDHGYVAIADKICNIPPSIQDIPEAAVSCIFIKPLPEIKVGTRIRCHTVKFQDNRLECETDGFGTCFLSLWTPRVEDGGLPSVCIPSGSNVTISSFKSPHAIYVQSLERKNKELLEMLLQDVASQSATAPCLDHPPEVGEVVACLYPEDQNFYRAQVYRRREDVFSVTYLDFGNSYDVSANDMRVLCDSLKKVPCCAVKIGLKDVSDNVFNSEAIFFLNSRCVQGNEPLYLEYDDNLKFSTLKTKEGISVNSKIDAFIRPNWKKCLEEEDDPTNGEVFFGSDLKYNTWTKDSKAKLLIVTQHSPNSFLVINAEDGLLNFMRDYYTPRVSEYCNSFSIHYQYNPRMKEICFVKQDDLWYRAVCTRSYDISCWVVLVDFGNRGKVLYKNIRPMTYEFMQVPSILKKCNILGLPDIYPDKTTEEKLREILKEGTLHDATISTEACQGVVSAYFDSVSEFTSNSLVKSSHKK